MKRIIKRLPYLLGAASVGLSVGVLHAQTASTPSAATPENGIDEIVVTAQKRRESVQDVPITISALNQAALTQANITTPGDLQRVVPTFKYTSSIGTLAARLSIRGIGTFSNSAIEPSVATFQDGIYLPRPASFINSLYDMEAVEVLSGPQGTLFGRNASVGAISFRTGTPTHDDSFSSRADYSTGNHIRSESVANIAVSEKVAVRAAFLSDTADGVWNDTLNGGHFGAVNTEAGRLSVKLNLTNDLDWTVHGDTQKNTGNGRLNAQLIPSSLTPTTIAHLTAAQGGIAPLLNEFSKDNNTYGGNFGIDDRFSTISSDLNYAARGGYTLRLLDGYNDWHSDQSDGDTAYLSIYVLGRDLFYRSQSNSHELQLISPKDQILGGKFDFVAGLYFFDEDLAIKQESLDGGGFCGLLVPLLNPGPFAAIPGATTAAKINTCQGYSGPSSIGDFTQNTKSLAGYTQGTIKVVPDLDLTLGLRYSDEKKSGNYTGTQVNPTGRILAANEATALELKGDRVTYRANLTWHPTAGTILFATNSTGFKSGGFNNGIATAVLGQARIFKAETVNNVEVGIKSQSSDHRFTVNATAYTMSIDNFQERSIVNTTSSIHNVGEVRQQGADLEGIVKVSANFKVNASVSYVDSKILSYCNAALPAYLPASTPPPASCPGAQNGTQDLKGAPLNYNPKWSAVVGAEVNGTVGSSGLSWLFNANVDSTSRQLGGTSIDNSLLTAIDGYTLLNARLTLLGRADKWSVGVFGTNLTDKGYCASTIYQVIDSLVGVRYNNNGVLGTAVRCNVGAPRIVGVSAAVKF